MKHEQVVPDYIVMLESSITVLALVGCGWLLFKLVSACFWFPQYMKNLEVEADKANAYLEKTLLPKGTGEISKELDCETKIPPTTPEKVAAKSIEDNEFQENEAIDDKVEDEATSVEEDKKDK